MKRKYLRLIILIMGLLWLKASLLSAMGSVVPSAPLLSVEPSTDEPALIDADQLRRAVLHNAGALYTPAIDGMFSYGYYTGGSADPETGEPMTNLTYPNGSGKFYSWIGSIWVGGIVDEDTLVSVGVDGWFISYEFMPDDRARGGARRTGHFADDEFLTVVTDTATDISSPFGHEPLGLQMEMRSYSWSDSLYDDFAILDYTVRNIGTDYIHDGWIGVYMDNDIYHISQQFNSWSDDISGTLDTVLDDDDADSRILIPYSFDNDGDPSYGGLWDDYSVTGIISFIPIGSSFPVERTNFNFWFSSGIASTDWGPRRLGTPEDPLRLFDDGNLGTPISDVDKYYVLSHPEIDFDQIETAIHDSSDGWIPPQVWSAADLADGYDTRFLYSFGPFDLPAGDSITFTLAVVAAEGFHADPLDYAEMFDPLLPQLYKQTFDFSELMLHCRRADSVYRSGYTLPHPGPPAGLKILDFDDTYASVSWRASRRPDLKGYYLYLRDTTYSDQYNRISGLLTDTTRTITLFEPTHTYYIGVSLIDTLGRESALSWPASVLPGRPHPPESLTVTLDGLIPEITWRPPDDSTIYGYYIFRAIWGGAFALYDSTATLRFRDYNTESGIQYRYKINAKNMLNLESDTVGPVSALPMALDQGVLFCNMNRFMIATPAPYPLEYVTRLSEFVASYTDAAIMNIDDGPISFKKLADHSVIVVDESNVPRTLPFAADTLALYLRGGGKAVFIKPAFTSLSILLRKLVYPEGNFYHDFLKLDSSVTSAITISGSSIVGDLYACQPLAPEYPMLYADTMKLADANWDLEGYIPLAGYTFPTDEAEPIYSYVSSNPDTVHHGAVNGYRYLGDDYSFVMLNFPLMAMTEQDSFYALRQALADLGVNMSCGDANMDGMANIGDAIMLIAYLYRAGPEPADLGRTDLNCSGDIDLGDVVGLINFIFKNGRLACCQ